MVLGKRTKTTIDMLRSYGFAFEQHNDARYATIVDNSVFFVVWEMKYISLLIP